MKSQGKAAPVNDKKLQPRRRRKHITDCDLAAVRGNSITAATQRAVEELGGIKRFVNRDDIVVIKPNIAWNRTPEYAATTNPEIVSTLISLCRHAGARTVRVFDNTCNNPGMSYHNSGIFQAARKAGAMVYHTADWKFLPASFPAGSRMQDWPVFKDAAECDCFINVPIAKHHSLTGLTLSMKNLMGVCGGNRGMIHWNIDEKLAELTEFISPDLTVIDAWRILIRGGPSSGNIDNVRHKNTVIASADPVLADSYAATLFNRKPGEIGHIRKGAEKGLGSMDIGRAKIRTVSI